MLWIRDTETGNIGIRMGRLSVRKAQREHTMIHLDQNAIDRAFPFHFVLQEVHSSWGHIAAFGSRLQDVAPELMPGRPFEDVFEVETPGRRRLPAAKPVADSLYLLRPSGRDDDFRLRGQFLQLQSKPTWIFLGAPWLEDLSDLERYGISLSDFPPHEALGDFLPLMTTRNIALRDQRDLTRKLRESATKLDERNRQLEQELGRREALEDRLRTKQKMEALGLLAGGVAHDFNNLMTAILGYASLARARVDQGSTLQNWLGEIEKATKRATALTNQLLTFSRQQVAQPRVVVLEDECAEAESMLRRLLGEKIRLISDYSDSPNRVLIDPSALHQIILNLVVNARDAMPEGGNVTIRTRKLPMEAPKRSLPNGEDFGSLLEVTDEGVGIEPEIIEKIFEPFFSHRPGTQGTGLGLATVLGAAQQAEGKVTVQSEVGKGSSFRVWFPGHKGSAGRRENERFEERPMAMHGHALLVEDDPSVRDLLFLTLSGSGLTLGQAANAEEAEEKARSTQELRYLITDVGLPGRSGPELAKRIQKIHPKVRILFISGYTQDEDFRRTVGAGRYEFLQKPFTPHDLMARLSNLTRQDRQRTAKERLRCTE